MLELNYALEHIMKGIDETVTEYGFRPEYPDGVFPPQLPIEKDGEKSVIMYRSERGRIRIEHLGDKLSLFCAKADDEAPDDDMKRASLSLLDLENFNDKDLKYIYEEYIETFQKLFSQKNAGAGKKMPTPVSRTQAKSGALAYDANTLGSRFTTIYPELRDEYKNNLELYGEFLAEDFFVNHGNKYVIETIKENDKIKMRKLFNLLNDIYEDGTNDTQSLVAVTILGSSLAANPELIDIAKEHFSDTMMEPVSEIISYLRKSKSARMRLENPPLYKPQKQKKKGMFASMLGM
ncbi:MAG: hypothetical protein J6K49_07440 [Clostridia bacterium]|nr:hypothetical protein [Clostridia bacterium]MBP3560479.1 hypothetical protein [Clostridia bacterium]MBQ6838562.1 hypothetical protein [Clostridia bacterium]